MGVLKDIRDKWLNSEKKDIIFINFDHGGTEDLERFILYNFLIPSGAGIQDTLFFAHRGVCDMKFNILHALDSSIANIFRHRVYKRINHESALVVMYLNHFYRNRHFDHMANGMLYADVMKCGVVKNARVIVTASSPLNICLSESMNVVSKFRYTAAIKINIVKDGLHGYYVDVTYKNQYMGNDRFKLYVEGKKDGTMENQDGDSFRWWDPNEWNSEE